MAQTRSSSPQMYAASMARRSLETGDVCRSRDLNVTVVCRRTGGPALLNNGPALLRYAAGAAQLLFDSPENLVRDTPLLRWACALRGCTTFAVDEAHLSPSACRASGPCTAQG